jgi:hypothetical protein
MSEPIEENQIQYLNTDLDLVCKTDPSLLIDALSEKGLFSMDVSKGEDGIYYAKLETKDDFASPESNISAMLAAIEALDTPHRKDWDECLFRDFNIGFDCGSQLRAFNTVLSSELVQRIAQVRAAVRITLYPPSTQSVH